MKAPLIIKTIAVIELAIGAATIISLAVYPFSKPANVFVYVFVSALISATVGLGMLAGKNWARALLVFFSAYVVVTKVFVFAGLLRVTGDVVYYIPTEAKNAMSIVYHVFVMAFLSQKGARQYFK